MTQRVMITDMSCDHCVMSVQNALEKLEGISSVSVNLKAGVATVEAESKISFQTYEHAIADAGYTVSSVE